MTIHTPPPLDMSKIVELEGTEKQVKWANDIRQKFLTRVKDEYERVNKVLERDDWTEEQIKSNLDYRLSLRMNFYSLCEIKEAATIIENRYKSNESWHAIQSMEEHLRHYKMVMSNYTPEEDNNY